MENGEHFQTENDAVAAAQRRVSCEEGFAVVGTKITKASVSSATPWEPLVSRGNVCPQLVGKWLLEVAG